MGSASPGQRDQHGQAQEQHRRERQGRQTGSVFEDSIRIEVGAGVQAVGGHQTDGNPAEQVDHEDRRSIEGAVGRVIVGLYPQAPERNVLSAGTGYLGCHLSFGLGLGTGERGGPDWGDRTA